MGRATSVDEYIAALQGPAREQLEALRSLAQLAAPEAAEAIRWGSPAELLTRMIHHRVREHVDDGVNWM